MGRIEHIGDATLYLGELFGMMYFPMFGASRQLQILNSVICLIAVFMMDYFVNAKGPPKMSFHNNAMQTPPGIVPVIDGCKRYISLRIMRHASSQKSLTAFTHSFFLQTSAALSYSLSKRPFWYRFFNTAITLAKPVMQSFSLGIIPQNSKSPKVKPCQIWDAVSSPVLSIGG